MNNNTFVCRICNNQFFSNIFFVREKMYGTGEEFQYVICPICKCMQIVKIPENLSDYYPQNYYSYKKTRKFSFKRKVKQKLYNLFSYIKNDFHKTPVFCKYGINYNDRKKNILDVGSGDGALLWEMRQNGFKNLTGIDPFLKNEINIKGLKIIRKTFFELKNRKYDIVMSHHSLEHMPDPNVFFLKVAELLKREGRLILRIPIYPNYIWDKYGVDWIQLDAPRHLYIFHRETIEFLTKKYGLAIEAFVDDAQPWALASTEYCLDGKSHKEFEKQFYLEEYHKNECDKAKENKHGDSVQILIKKNE